VSNGFFLLPELSWHRLVVVNSVLHFDSLVLLGLLLEFLTLLIEVVFSQSDVTADHL